MSRNHTLRPLQLRKSFDGVYERDIIVDEQTILGQLEELVDSLGIQSRCEPIKKEATFSPGGLCRLKGEYVLILNSNATLEEKVQILARAVTRFDLSQRYLRPGLREFLDRFPGAGDVIPS